jgi:hypothetical protein
MLKDSAEQHKAEIEAAAQAGETSQRRFSEEHGFSRVTIPPSSAYL